MTLPFINQRVRARVRVVDFMPDNIEDFARSLDDETYNEWDPYSDTIPLSDTNKWEWAFYLLVEDAKPVAGEEPMQLSLQVFGEEAKKLLGLDPADLRKDQNALNQLKEKLFTLWGDLEELKSAGKLEGSPSNKPFECCIMEFGVKEGDDWVRIHAICETSIR
jgi:protection-of-telomeres protein 1